MASAGMDTIRFHCGSEATSGPTINAVPGDDRETQTLGGSLTFLRRFRGAVPPARDAARTETWGDVESAGERSLLADLLGDGTPERTDPAPSVRFTSREVAEPDNFADPGHLAGRAHRADAAELPGTAGLDLVGFGSPAAPANPADLAGPVAAMGATDSAESARSTRKFGRVAAAQRPRDLPFRAAVAAIVSLGAVGAVWALASGAIGDLTGGFSEGSGSSTGLTGLTSGAAAARAPVSLVVTDSTDTSVTLAWDDPNEGSVRYRLLRTPGVPQLLPIGTDSISVTGLDPAVETCFRVAVFGTSGEATNASPAVCVGGTPDSAPAVTRRFQPSRPEPKPVPADTEASAEAAVVSPAPSPEAAPPAGSPPPSPPVDEPAASDPAVPANPDVGQTPPGSLGPLPPNNPQNNPQKNPETDSQNTPQQNSAKNPGKPNPTDPGAPAAGQTPAKQGGNPAPAPAAGKAGA
jgi:hypothetical protein